MAYTAATPARKILDAGFYAVPVAGAALAAGPGSVFSYCSSHAAEDLVGSAFFTACGAQPLSSTGPVHPNLVARSTANVGMRVGDLLVNVESSAGVTPGRCTWHAITGSTFNGSTATYAASAGYDCTVAAHAST